MIEMMMKLFIEKNLRELKSNQELIINQKRETRLSLPVRHYFECNNADFIY